MGVPFQITLYAESEAEALNAAKAAYHRIEELNQILSHYEYESELSRLSRSAGSGKSLSLSDELWTVLDRAQALSRQTDGAFDVTIGLCARLWSKARHDKEFPSDHHLSMVLKTVGFQALELDPNKKTATLHKDRMLLDLSGIAKGYALDEAWQTLKKKGIRTALIQAGGDLRACGSPPDKEGWIAALATPSSNSNSKPLASVQLHDKALASSGDLIQFVEIGGKHYSHILNPLTGIGLTNRCLVHVIAPDGMTADSLATTLNVLGPEKGIALVEKKEGVEARISIATEQGVEIFDTTGFASFLIENRE